MLAPIPPPAAAEEPNPLLARVDELERGLRVEAQKREALEQRAAEQAAAEALDEPLGAVVERALQRRVPRGEFGLPRTRSAAACHLRDICPA